MSYWSDKPHRFQGYIAKPCEMCGKGRDYAVHTDANTPYPSPLQRPEDDMARAIEDLWHTLDALVEEIMAIREAEPKDSPRLAALQGEAKGLGNALERISSPFLGSAALEAKKRWEIRHDKREFEPTPMYHRGAPGTGDVPVPDAFKEKYPWPPAVQPQQSEWQKEQPTLPGTSGPVAYRPTRVPPVAAQSRVTAPKVNEQEREAIKFACSSGMFTTAEVAKTYGLSEAQVKLIIGEG